MSGQEPGTSHAVRSLPVPPSLALVLTITATLPHLSARLKSFLVAGTEPSHATKCRQKGTENSWRARGKREEQCACGARHRSTCLWERCWSGALWERSGAAAGRRVGEAAARELKGPCTVYV